MRTSGSGSGNLSGGRSRPIAMSQGVGQQVGEQAAEQDVEEDRRPPPVERRDRRDDEEDRALDADLREGDEDVVEPRRSVVDDPALEPSVDGLIRSGGDELLRRLDELLQVEWPRMNPAPRAVAVLRDSSSTLPLNMITGIEPTPCRSWTRRSISQPSTFGIITSRRMRSGGSPRAPRALPPRFRLAHRVALHLEVDADELAQALVVVDDQDQPAAALGSPRSGRAAALEELVEVAAPVPPMTSGRVEGGQPPANSGYLRIVLCAMPSSRLGRAGVSQSGSFAGHGQSRLGVSFVAHPGNLLQSAYSSDGVSETYGAVVTVTVIVSALRVPGSSVARRCASRPGGDASSSA